MSDSNIHALPIGHSFDGYRILRVLGAGGFGITYLAEETAIGRKVAIKEYLPQGYAARAADSFTVRAVSSSVQPQFAWGLDRFRKEAATLVAFEHPNIVSVYRYFEANGTAYLVMQYVEGKPLDALLAKGKTLAESEIEEVILPILDGLEQVHAAHFLHRDVKPANIYIRRDGRPVLLDFGAARQAFGGETKSITAIVSEGYAPFEQYEAKGDQGPWTDVYAIGAVLYRCIAGDRPPAAPERVSARLRGAADPMPPARELGKGRYSPHLLEATDRALSTMPGDRPQSIAELRQQLRGASRVLSRAEPRRDPADRGDSASATITAGRAKTRSRVPLLAGIAGVLAAGGVAAYFALGSKPSTPSTASAPRPAEVSAAVPAAPQTPAPPAAEEPAERAAKEAEARADADLAALKETIGRGELARAKGELAALLGRIDEAQKKRPDHAGLKRVGAAARAAEAELAQRIAARVKELVESAEREAARNYDEAQRLAAEAERLDPAAAKAARERIEQIRRAAQEKSDETSRQEAERKRAEEERKRIEEERRARQAQIDLHVSLARYHLDQAASAAREKRYGEARRTLEQVSVQLKRAVELGRAGEGGRAGGPEPAAVAAVRRDFNAFERDLARKIADHVAGLVIEARRLAGTEKFEDALRLLDEAAELEPASAAVTEARRSTEAARKQFDDEQRRRGEAETRRRNEADALVRIARQRLDQAKAALEGKRLAEAKRLAEDAAGTAGEAARVARELPQVASAQRDVEALQRDIARRITARVAELVQEARTHIQAGRFDDADRNLDEAADLEPASATVTEARRAAEAARKQFDDEQRRRGEAETRRRNEADTLVRIARQRLDQAKAALEGKRLAEARRLAEDAAGTAGEAARVARELPQVASAQREIEALQRDVARRIAARVAELVQDARTHIKAGRLDDAGRSIDEAERLEPASDTVGAARRDLAAARKQADEDRRRREDEARRREEEDKKKQEAARPADPDAAERERTKDVIAESGYSPAARRGSAYFAFGSAHLTAEAARTLMRGTAAAREDASSYIQMSCSYDQLEVKDAAEGRALAQTRCERAQQALTGAGLARTRVRAALAPATGKGPTYRRVFFTVLPEKAPDPQKPSDAAKPPETAARPGAFNLAGRTGSLSRISPERRAVMRIHLQFGSGGTMGVSCVAELADGGQSACFGQANGTGSWSLNGASLCLASQVINLASNTCYQLSGSGNQLVLSGPGILAGAMFLR